MAHHTICCTAEPMVFLAKQDDCTEVLESHKCQESMQAGLKEVKIRGRELFSKLACFSDIHS